MNGEHATMNGNNGSLLVLLEARNAMNRLNDGHWLKLMKKDWIKKNRKSFMNFTPLKVKKRSGKEK